MSTQTDPKASGSNSSDSETRDYSKTLFLPQTAFPMRAGLPKREPEWLARWQEMRLYDQIRKDSRAREVRAA
jgi:isoleucyl-tRNA synthetase